MPDIQHAENSLFGSPLDFAGLVHRDLVEWQRVRGKAWLEQESSLGMSCDFVAETFYRTQRLPRWVGQGKLRDALCGIQFNPLYSRDLIQIYNQLPHTERSGERVHFELMCHLWKDLADLPFAHDRWDRKMVDRSHWSLHPSEPVGHSSPISGAGWQVHALREQWPEVTDWLLDSAEMLRPIISRRKLESFVEACRPLVFGGSSWRTRMSHPLMVLRIGGRASAALPRLLSLCTILTLHDELRSPLERSAILEAE